MDESPTNTNAKKMYLAAERKIKEHLEKLQEQFFCLSLRDCFIEFPEAQTLTLQINEGKYGELNIDVLVNGEPDDGNDITEFINNNASEANLRHFQNRKKDLYVDRDNIQAAWQEWGAERWTKWKAVNTEDTLRQIGEAEPVKHKPIRKP